MRRASFAIFLTALVATPALAVSPFGPEYCAKTYSASRDTLRGNWKVLALYFSDGRSLLRKTSDGESSACQCPKDNAAMCECTTTTNRLPSGSCEEGNL